MPAVDFEYFISMKNSGYFLIIISWVLILAGIINELVLPYDSIIKGSAEIQSNNVLISLNKLYWYFIPAALAGFAGGLFIHKSKKENSTDN